MEPTLHFLYNISTVDEPYDIWGTNSNWREMNTVSGSGLIEDKIIITGGGILNFLPTPTCPINTRDATIKPSTDSYVIPQLYVETSELMYNVPMAGFGGLLNAPFRYVFGIYVDGSMASDLYVECWEDQTFSTTSLEMLQGTPNSGGNSFVNAIRTTGSEPPWPAGGWSGADSEATYLRGTEHRLGLKNASSIADEVVYFNMYVRLPTDCSTFHAQPAFCFRYLYT